MAVSISISIAQNSQNITTNKSNVTVTVTASWTNGSNNRLVAADGTPQAKGWVKIDGTTYNFASTFNDNQTSSGSKVVCTKTVNIAHNSDGKKTLSCSASYTTGVSSGTVTASASKTLTTIPRKSTLDVGNGTLGVSQLLTVTRKSDSFTHSIKAVCGNSTLYIKADGSTQSSEVKHSDCSLMFTPPISWAAQNTTGTSVTVKYTITTYSGSTNVGSNSYTKTYSIPGSVKPSCSLTVVDSEKYYDTYGGFVRGLSKFKVTVSSTTAQGSPIASYKTTANGSTYASSSFTTGVLSSSGSLTISATVTDKRGRTGTASVKKTVFDYAAPNITMLTVKRCNEDGKENDRGKYVLVSFSATLTNINGRSLNKPSYSIRFKKTSASVYESGDISKYNNQYSVNNGQFIFEADDASSWNVEFTVTDGINTASRATTASTGFTLMHWNSNGNGIGIGKVSEIDGVLDIGLETRFVGGLMYPVLPEQTDLNSVLTPGFYAGENVDTHDYANCPFDKGTFTLEVLSSGPNGQIWQRLTLCDKSVSTTYERFYYGGTWGEWVRTSDFGGTLLWQGVYYMSKSQIATLKEPVSKQNNGIVLVFSRYSSSQAQNYHFNHAFVHKMFVKTHPGVGNTFMMTTDGSFSVMATKYLYIHDDRIEGNDINEATATGTSGIKYENNGFVLRYVIGV